jgi:hypothetical protein
VAQDPWAIDNSGGLPAYSAQELRLATVTPYIVGNGASLGTRSGVRLGGSGTELLVQAQASPNMTVKVNPGIFVAQGQTSSTQGSYTWCLDAVTNLTIAASHATLARTDLVAVRIRDANIDTSGARDGNVIVVTGTNGGGVPALPTDATYYTIAQISVPAAVTTIGGGGGGTITDHRTFVAALGGTVPFVSTARPAGMVDGAAGWEIDTRLPYRYSTTAAKWLREPVDLYKTADTTYTSTTTLANDPTLQFAGEANCTYTFQFMIGFLGTVTPKYKWTPNYPTGAVGHFTRVALDSSGVQFNDFAATISPGSLVTVSQGTGAATTGTLLIHGTVFFGGTAGTFAWQAAQNVSNGTSSNTLKGSWLRYRQVG